MKKVGGDVSFSFMCQRILRETKRMFFAAFKRITINILKAFRWLYLLLFWKSNIGSEYGSINVTVFDNLSPLKNKCATWVLIHLKANVVYKKGVVTNC